MAVMLLCVCCRFDRSPSDIVLYGQSVGSGPSVDLAARTRGLGGVVLHSPLMSGTMWLQQMDVTWPADNVLYVCALQTCLMVVGGCGASNQIRVVCCRHAGAKPWLERLALLPGRLRQLKADAARRLPRARHAREKLYGVMEWLADQH